MKLNLPHEQIAAFCRKWNVSELALFGSAVRDDFRPDSDVDVLVTFVSPELTPSLFEHVDMQDELEAIFGRKVDVANRSGVERSDNPFRKRAVLGSAQRIYPPGPEGGSIRIVSKGAPLDRDPGLLYDMLAAARLADEFIAGMTVERFKSDDLAIAAVSQVLTQVGHAAAKVSAGVRERHPEIAWSEMAEFADRLLHEYRDVRADEVWRNAHAAARAVPALEPLVPPVEDDNEEQAK